LLHVLLEEIDPCTTSGAVQSTSGVRTRFPFVHAEPLPLCPKPAKCPAGLSYIRPSSLACTLRLAPVPSQPGTIPNSLIPQPGCYALISCYKD